MDATDVKQVQRVMWSVGDFPDIAPTIQAAADVVVDRVAPKSGDEMLDVATGTGNVAIPAAQRGATVTGLDLTPELFEAARARATEAGVEVEWIEGDAEQLPFADDSFDKVTSTFGVMFAPRQEVAAAELVRVARPGAQIALAAWTPEGLNGTMFRTVASHMPPPDHEFKPPVMWGVEDHVRTLFPNDIELEFERLNVVLERESTEDMMSYAENVLGPMVLAKAALEPQGKWDALRADLLKLYDDNNLATDGSMRCEAEYLLVTARLPQ